MKNKVMNWVRNHKIMNYIYGIGLLCVSLCMAAFDGQGIIENSADITNMINIGL